MAVDCVLVLILGSALQICYVWIVVVTCLCHLHLFYL